MEQSAYRTKVRLWVEHPVLFGPPRATGWVPFGSRKFSSYEAFNRWKREYRKKLAAAGGLKWTK